MFSIVCERLLVLKVVEVGFDGGDDGSGRSEK
jgi:hypothetical protein